MLSGTTQEYGGLLPKRQRTSTKCFTVRGHKNRFDFQRHGNTYRNDLSRTLDQQGRIGSITEVVYEAKRGGLHVNGHLMSLEHQVVVVVPVQAYKFNHAIRFIIRK